MESKKVNISNVLHNPESIRVDYDSETFENLVTSIQSVGLLLPLSVTPENENGNYEVIDGDHRLEAAIKAGLKEIDVVVCSDNEDVESMKLVRNFILNRQRVNLSFAECAATYLKLKDMPGMNKAKVMEMIGITGKTIDSYNEFSELDEETRNSMIKGELPSNDIIISKLLKLYRETDEKYYKSVVHNIIANNLIVKDTVTYLCNTEKVAKLPVGIRAYFNDKDLPCDEDVINLFIALDDEDKDIDLVDKVHTLRLSPVEIRNLCGDYLQLISKCPEFLDQVAKSGFPTDHTLLESIPNLAFKDKRLFIVNFIISKGLSTSSALALMNSINDTLTHIQPELQELFWKGTLPLDSGIFFCLTEMPETWSLATRMKVIDAANYENIAVDTLYSNLKDQTAEMIRTIEELRKIAPELPIDKLSDTNAILETLGVPKSITRDSDPEEEAEDSEDSFSSRFADKKVRGSVSEDDESDSDDDVEDVIDDSDCVIHITDSVFPTFSQSVKFAYGNEEANKVKKNLTKKSITMEEYISDFEFICRDCQNNSHYNRSEICPNCKVAMMVKHRAEENAKKASAK